MLKQLKKQIQQYETNLTLHKALIQQQRQQAAARTQAMLTSPQALLGAFLMGLAWGSKRRAILMGPHSAKKTHWLNKLSSLMSLIEFARFLKQRTILKNV